MISPARRERFLRQPISIRLGNLASNLARIASFVEISANASVVGLIDESRAFIEWSAPEIEIENAARLVDIERGLTHWLFKWNTLSESDSTRNALVQDTRAWAEQVLALSGLLEQ